MVATPFTFRFPDVADGDLLPADNLLLYHGDVRDFLDIAIWANRDDEKGVDLAVLFEDAVNDQAVQGALAVVGGLVVAAAPRGRGGRRRRRSGDSGTGRGLAHQRGGRQGDRPLPHELPAVRAVRPRPPTEDGFRTAKGIDFAYEVVDPG